jgi:alpha-L-rhamnosidase
MKTRYFVLCALLAMAALLLHPSPAQAAGHCQPVRLQCENLNNPLGIDVAAPRLEWRLESKVRGDKQTACQIMAATTREALAADKPDLWDSSKLVTPDNRAVYAGAPLASQENVFWKVRVWDREDRPSAWSAPAQFSIGLLTPGDWTGKWIGTGTGKQAEPAPYFRKTFTIEKPVSRATVSICGLGYHELRLNGAKVGDHVLDPAFTRFDRRALYVTHDVTSQITRGANAIGIVLGNGWLNYQAANAWNFDKAPWRQQPRVLAQLRLEFKDGTTQTLATDDTWKYSTGPIVFDSFMNGETYDARLEIPGWDTAKFNDSSWTPARVVEAPKGRVTPQMAPPIRITETLKPAKITQPKPGVYVVDLGQNIAGGLRLTVKGPAGAEIKMVCAELLNPDGTINNNNIKEHTHSGEFQTFRYILKGNGTETWEPIFMYGGYQYIEITGFPGEPKADNILGLVMHTDLESIGSFECSNELLNKIQHATRWSYLNNFIGYPTDCPNRERNGWTGDAQLAAETGLYNFDATAAYAKWMRDFRDEQRPSGELPGIIPTGGWGYAWGNGPAWDAATIVIPWDIYQFRKETNILAEHYESMKRYVDYLTTRSKEGIVTIGLGDWCPVKTTTPAELTSTAYYYKDAQILSQIATILGKDTDAAQYRKLAGEIRTAFNAHFFDPKTRQYGGGTQTALSCALYQGLVDETNQAAVVSNLVANVKAHDNHLDCGILGTKYLLHALTDNGQAELAYKIATQETFPSWGHWIKQGATTLWEGWDGSGTHNHIMFGDISAWLYTTLGGINHCCCSQGVGFSRIFIEPQILGGLTWVKARYDSIRGPIVSEWKRDGSTFRIKVTIPPGATGSIAFPATGKDSVTEGGKSLAKAVGVKPGNLSDGKLRVTVESGTYDFESRGLK